GGQVVGSGPQPAADDAEVGARGGFLQRADDVVAPVAHHGGAPQCQTQRVQARGGDLGVGVGDLAAHHFVAGDDELDLESAHVPKKRPRSQTAAQVSAHAQTPAKTSSSTTPAPFFQRGSTSKKRAGGGLSTSQMRKSTKPVKAAKTLRGRYAMVMR